MPVETRNRLLAIIDRLKPSDLLSQARAFVLTRSRGGFDIVDGDEEDLSEAWAKAADRATELGEAFAIDETILRTFLPDVFAERSPMRAWKFGKGLATGVDDVAHVWATLHSELTKMPENARNVTVLGGFLSGAAGRDAGFAAGVLDGLSGDPVLAHRLPWLQSQVALDRPGIQRLVNAIDAGKIEAKDLYQLATGVVRDAPALPLATLLVKIAAMPDGSMLALEILHMHLYSLKDDGRDVGPALITCGRVLLANVNFSDSSRVGDFGLKEVVKACLSGPSGKVDTRTLCRRIRKALDDHRLSAYKIGHLLEGLFETQPSIALDELVMAGVASKRDQVFETRFNRPTPIEKVEAATLRAWANLDSAKRYPALGHVLALFATNVTGDETGLSPRFLKMLEDAPDRAAFLGNARDQIRPCGWSGPLHLVLERRRTMLRALSSHHDPAVRAWLADQETWLATWIAAERERESEREESFE